MDFIPKVNYRFGLLWLAITVFLAPDVFAAPLSVTIDIDCHSTSSGAGRHEPDLNADGTWSRPRRDAGLTGRSPLIGSISCPQALWDLDLSRRGMWLELIPATSNDTIDLTASRQGNFWAGRRLFDRTGGFADLNGDGGRTERRGGHDRVIGDFSESIPGFEKIECNAGANGGDPTPGSCYLHRWSGTGWVRVWKSEPLEHVLSYSLSHQSPVVADVDNDGELEISVTAWYLVHVLDFATGKLEYSGEFTAPDNPERMSGRPYGLQGVFDVAGDARKEIIILSDFLPTIQVLGWNGSGQLTERWDRVFETGIELNKTIHLVLANAISDVAGNADPEIATNVFNETGDDRWHALILDAGSGKEIVNARNYFIAGIWDLDGDGRSELLLNTASGQRVKKSGPAIIATVEDGALVEKARLAGEGFAWTLLRNFPEFVNGRATLADADRIEHPAVFSGWDGRHAVFATSKAIEPERNRITLWSYDGTDVTEVASLTGPGLEIIGTEAVDGSGAIMVRASFLDPSEAGIELTNAALRTLHSDRIGRSSGPAAVYGSLLTGTVVGQDANSRPLIVTQAFDDNIEAYSPDPISGEPELAWRAPGRGMFSGAVGVNMMHDGVASIASYNPFGNGPDHFLVADRSSHGSARLTSLKPDGTQLWARDFDVFGELPVWNNSGITHWLGGNFRSGEKHDAYVVQRFSNMHDEKGLLLNGRTGSVVWRLNRSGQRSACTPPGHSGPTPYQTALIDWNGDGRDDLVDLANSSLSVFSGANGARLYNRWVHKSCEDNDFFDFDTFENEIVGVVDQFNENAPVSVMWGGNSANLGMIRVNGQTPWGTPSYTGMPRNTLQVPADLNGDGILEIVVIGHCGTSGDQIHAYNSETGKRRWTMSHAKVCQWPPPAAPSAVDMDGDGRQEVIYTHQSTVYALAEDARQGVLRWQAKVGSGDWWPHELGSPVIADVQGFGQPQILLNTADGRLISLGMLEADGDGDGYPDRVDGLPGVANDALDFDNDGSLNGADTDDDNDEIPDRFERKYGLNPFDPVDAEEDPDRDGLNNLREYRLGTSISSGDTDRDGIDDATEADEGGNPLVNESAVIDVTNTLLLD